MRGRHRPLKLFKTSIEWLMCSKDAAYQTGILIDP